MADVSVIIPVFNAADFLRECLDSILHQEMGSYTLQVIAVDDGSTDGSGSILDEYVANYTSMEVIHQTNSGGPGGPRNRGIEAAIGRYMFFCDADDYMNRESLRRMVVFADRHQCDLLIPKLVGVEGRWIRDSIYRETQIDADLLRASQSAGPTKLFRTEMVDAHGLVFPEGMMLAEDTIMVFRALTTARRVSILADYDYYFARARADSANITSALPDPVSYTRSLIAAAGVIGGSMDSRVIERAIILELFRRVCLAQYRGEQFTSASPARRQQWVEVHQEFLDRFLPAGSEWALKSPQRERMALVREGRIHDLVKLARSGGKQRTDVAVVAFSRMKRGLQIEVRTCDLNNFQHARSIHLEIVSRLGGEVLSFKSQYGLPLGARHMCTIAPASEHFKITLDLTLLEAIPPGTWELVAVVDFDRKGPASRARINVKTKLGSYTFKDNAIYLFPTKTGHLGLKVGKENRSLQRPRLSRRALYSLRGVVKRSRRIQSLQWWKRWDDQSRRQ